MEDMSFLTKKPTKGIPWQSSGWDSFTDEGPDSIPGQGTGIPQASWHAQKIFLKKNKYK